MFPLWSGITVRSDGPGKAKITTDATSSSIFNIAADGCEFYNLDMVSSSSGAGALLVNGARDDLTVMGCRFEGYNRGVDFYGNNAKNRALISHNRFKDCNVGVYGGLLKYCAVHENVLENCVRGIQLIGAQNCSIRGNTVQGDGVTSIVGIILLYQHTVMPGNSFYANTISGNTVSDVTEEGISLDGASGTNKDVQHGDTATSATASTITATGAGRTIDADIGYYIVIVNGTGRGQVREITDNTADTWTVDEDWETTPDATSDFIVASISLNNTVNGNTVYRAGTAGISMFGVMLSNSIGNNACFDCDTGIVVAGVNHDAGAEIRAPAFHNTINGNVVSVSSGGTGADWGIAVRVSDGHGTADYTNLGNVVQGNTVTGPYTRQIYIDRSIGTVVTNNVCANAKTYGIREEDAADYSIIMGNVVYGAATTDISTIGANTIQTQNITGI